MIDLAINLTSMVFTVIGALISAVALLLGYLGYKNVRANQIETIRPYLVAKYRIEGEPKIEQGVFLDISNHGKTAARNVILDFDPNDAWRETSGERYPFLRRNQGISSLSPGETGSYFVGRLTGESKLQALREEFVTVTFSYTALADDTEFTEIDRISFMDLANSQRLVPDRRKKPATTKAASKTTPKKSGVK